MENAMTENTLDHQETFENPAQPRQQEQSQPQESDADIEDLQPDQPQEPDRIEANLETVLEAVLFASDEPLSAIRLAEIAEAGTIKQIRQAVKTLNDKYRQAGCVFRIEQIAGGYRMMTLPMFAPWLDKLLRVRSDSKLSPAALETLAIIAYKQPVIRADIETVRGVACGEIIRSLMYKALVKIVGRAEVLGRPMLYGTTKKFLDVFGLADLKDLPKVEELKAPQA